MCSRLQKSFLALLIASICAVGKTHATLVNGGFESGDFTRSSSIDDASVINSSFENVPPEGSFQPFISNAPADVSYGNPANTASFSRTNSVAHGLASLLGITEHNIRPFEQSGIKQVSSTATAGFLRLIFNYLTGEGNTETDPAVFVVDGTVLILTCGYYWTTPCLGNSPLSSPSIFLAETGSPTGSIYVAPGTQILGFGIGEEADPRIMSALLLDEVSFGAVPEPSTLLLIGSGLVVIAAWGRRRIRRTKVTPNIAESGPRQKAPPASDDHQLEIEAAITISPKPTWRVIWVLGCGRFRNARYSYGSRRAQPRRSQIRAATAPSLDCFSVLSRAHGKFRRNWMSWRPNELTNHPTTKLHDSRPAHRQHPSD